MIVNKHVKEVNKNLESLYIYIYLYLYKGKQNKHVKVETKKTNKILGFLGNSIRHARTSLCMHNQACMRKQDYVYTSPCLENLKKAKIE